MRWNSAKVMLQSCDCRHYTWLQTCRLYCCIPLIIVLLLMTRARRSDNIGPVTSTVSLSRPLYYQRVFVFSELSENYVQYESTLIQNIDQ